MTCWPFWKLEPFRRSELLNASVLFVASTVTEAKPSEAPVAPFVTRLMPGAVEPVTATTVARSGTFCCRVYSLLVLSTVPMV